MQHSRRFIFVLIAALILSTWGIAVTASQSASQPLVSTFEQVWQTVDENFYDPNFNGVNWAGLREKYRPLARQARSQSQLADVTNQMLSELNTSHTHFYTPDDTAYYQLSGIFLTLMPEIQQQLESYLTNGKPLYSGIGIFTEQKDDRIFVSGVLEGSPAESAGLLVGDQLLTAGGQPFHPINSFLNRADQPVALQVQRSSESQIQLTVIPQMLDGAEMFLEAMKQSIEVMEVGGKRIGYVHLWSYAGEQFHKQLQNELFYGQLKDVDSFILDLRDGWGGASASYLNIYAPWAMEVTGTARGYPPATSTSAWNKPVVMLVNERSRSGKELLAYGFRKYGIGSVVGAKTAGAVVNGNLYVMNDGSLLYLAIVDIHVDDNHRIEGVGVEPDIEVPFALEYAQGKDPQKEKAIEVAREAAR